MGEGALSGWTSQIQPFFDRPDIKRTIVWYSVPQGTPPGPPSFVFPNWNDDRDNFYPIGVGNVPHTMKPYFGPVPAPGLTAQVGTDDQFFHGLSYADYVAGGGSPATPCQVLPLGAPKVKAASRTTVSLTTVTGCRQQGTPCPGLLIPCVVRCRFSRLLTVYYNGPATWFPGIPGWITTPFTTPMFGTQRCLLQDGGAGAWAVFIGNFRMVPQSSTCSPFDVQAAIGLFPPYRAEFSF
jgi:hypothetical protein